MSDTILKVASITPESIENINHFQSQLKTDDGKNVILIAYEQE